MTSTRDAWIALHYLSWEELPEAMGGRPFGLTPKEAGLLDAPCIFCGELSPDGMAFEVQRGPGPVHLACLLESAP